VLPQKVFDTLKALGTPIAFGSPDWRAAMSIVQLTPWQRRKLRTQLRRADDASYYRRLLAVLELDRGQSVAQVADVLRVTRQSVYNWACAFAADPDPAALQDHYGIGRPSAWTEELQALLLASLDQRPDALGYAGVNWTVPLLQVHLDRCGGRWLSDDTIRRELDRLGYVWKRFRYVLPPDPQREKKTRHPAAAAGAATA
jgi:transposase